MNMIDYILQGFFLSGSKLFAVNKNTMEIYEYIVIYLHTFFVEVRYFKKIWHFPLKTPGSIENSSNKGTCFILT